MVKNEFLHDRNYKGEKTPKTFSEGPLESRKCTDCMCCLVFLLFWVGAGYISIYGFLTGTSDDYLYLYAFNDGRETQCGIDATATYPYLLWNVFDNGTINMADSYCVQTCPPDNQTDVTAYGLDTPLKEYATYLLANRICWPAIPSMLDSAVGGGADAISQDFFTSAFSDLSAIYSLIPIVAGSALLIGFIYLLIMRYCVGVMTWILLLFFVLGLTFIGLICYPGLLASAGFSESSFSGLTNINTTYLQAIAIASWVFAGISLILIIVFFNKIRLSIAVLKCASQFIEMVPSALLIPPIFFLLNLTFYAIWVYCAIYLIGTNQFTAPAPGTYSPFATITWSTQTEIMLGYYIYALFWGSTFLMSLSQFIIASACAIWYFRQSDFEKPMGNPIFTSIARGIGLHCGSIAFDASLVAVIQFVRFILNYLEGCMRYTKEKSNNHRFLIYLCCCTGCCLDCFERLLRFINKQVFVQIAMTGQNFCKASREALFLSMRNYARFGIVHGLGNVFCLIGQMFITASATFIGYIIMQNDYSNEIYSTTIPLLIFLLLSFLIGHNFMTVYGVAADGIMHVYCMDEEMHDNPRHAPQLLREFVKNHVGEKMATDF